MVCWVYNSKVQVISEWLHTWGTLGPRDRQRARISWLGSASHVAAAPGEGCRRRARGPITPTIAVLLSIRWGPIRRDQWEDAPGALWKYPGGDYGDVANAIASQAARINWERAARGHNGHGLEGGADVTAVRRTIAAQEKLDKGGPGLMRNIAGRGSWSAARLADAYGGSVLRALCKASGANEMDTEVHHLWTCPHNLSQDLDEKREFLRLTAEAKGQTATWPCFWFRCLVP